MLFCTNKQVGTDFGQIDTIMATAVELYFSRNLMRSTPNGLSFLMKMNQKWANISAEDNSILINKVLNKKSTVEYHVLLDYGKDVIIYFNPTSATVVFGIIMDTFQKNAINKWTSARESKRLRENVNEDEIFTAIDELDEIGQKTIQYKLLSEKLFT